MHQNSTANLSRLPTEAFRPIRLTLSAALVCLAPPSARFAQPQSSTPLFNFTDISRNKPPSQQEDPSIVLLRKRAALGVKPPLVLDEAPCRQMDALVAPPRATLSRHVPWYYPNVDEFTRPGGRPWLGVSESQIVSRQRMPELQAADMLRACTCQRQQHSTAPLRPGLFATAPTNRVASHSLRRGLRASKTTSGGYDGNLGSECSPSPVYLCQPFSHALEDVLAHSPGFSAC
jgi:hypothetical protein